LYINQYGSSGSHRKVAIIDKNQDLYISPVHKPQLVKVASMVSSAMWNDKTDMLAAIFDGKFVVWLYPNIFFFSQDLQAATRYLRDYRSVIFSFFARSVFFFFFSSVHFFSSARTLEKHHKLPISLDRLLPYAARMVL
jgi:hypothetical protein